MSARFAEVFSASKKPVLSIYFTAGAPVGLDSVRMLETLEQSGVGMVELGFPFSDPIADGPVIQASNAQALAGGMTLEKLLHSLEGVRERVSIPLVLMGSINPVLRYGVERFAETAARIGIDGTILPDIPLPAYQRLCEPAFSKAGIGNIFLVTPETTAERVELLAKATHGFLYLVSSSSTTGTHTATADALGAYCSRVRSLAGDTPIVVGFGIRDRGSFQDATTHADGAIIGTAFVRTMGTDPSAAYDAARSFIATILPQGVEA